MPGYDIITVGGGLGGARVQAVQPGATPSVTFEQDGRGETLASRRCQDQREEPAANSELRRCAGRGKRGILSVKSEEERI